MKVKDDFESAMPGEFEREAQISILHNSDHISRLQA